MAVRDEHWVRRLGFAVLGLALAPIVVAVGRAVASGWVPTFDGGYFTVRSRDVLTSHHPWHGAWSSGSASVDATIHNLGPLQFDLLAPFTKVDPYWGTAVGVGVVAVASVVAVWWAADRVFGPVGAVAAMLATLALEATIGTQAFIDPRQHIYLLMPYWALLWLTWATATGRGAAIPPLAFAASLITQTHFTYLLQTAVLVLVGLGLYVAVTLRGPRPERHRRPARWRSLGCREASPPSSGTVGERPAQHGGCSSGSPSPSCAGRSRSGTRSPGSATSARCSPTEGPVRASGGTRGPSSSPARCSPRRTSGVPGRWTNSASSVACHYPPRGARSSCGSAPSPSPRSSRGLGATGRWR